MAVMTPAIPSIIIIMPPVSKTEIEVKRRVPVVVIERIIAPVITDPEIRIIPPIVSESKS
jgi:hypothetical protein